MALTTKDARCFGILGLAALLAACAQRGTDYAPGTNRDLDISVTGKRLHSPITAEQNAAFSVLIRNQGSRDAQNVKIVDTVGRQAGLISISCKARGKATCPDHLGQTMVAQSLPSGSALEFLVTVGLVDHGTGTIVNSMSASVPGDNYPNDNEVTDDVLVR